MDNMTIDLNDRLANASKKFSKACDQIKLLKQRIAELIKMFSYCDQTNQFNESFNNNNNETNHIQNLIFNITSDRLILNNKNNLNVNLFRETIRQQIENLQSIKTAYFMYAHKKADEITKLQCELYGEDAVREAYEMTTNDSALPDTTSDQEDEIDTDSNQNETEDDMIDSNDQLIEQDDNSNELNLIEDHSDWPQWDLTQQNNFNNISSSTNSSIHNHSSIINEHDYLIA